VSTSSNSGRAPRLWLTAAATLAIALGIGTAQAADAPTKVLDSKIYKQRCLMCHSTATPEGVAAKVVEGTSAAKSPPTEATAAALKAMGLKCWRRCEKCWPSK
jgi:hypothetical protein